MTTAKNDGSDSTSVPATTKKMELATPMHDYGDFAGEGYEGAEKDDFKMPFLALLQTTSPEVGAEGPDKALENAKPGMLMNTVTKELYDGKTGLIFVPVARQHVFVEWRKRKEGGGLVARHTHTSEVANKAKAHAKEIGADFGKFEHNGNDLVETFYFIGYTLEAPDSEEPKEVIVIGFNSTKIPVYQGVMQKLNSFKKPSPPLFANRLLVKSVPDRNNKGNFFNFAIEPLFKGVGPSLIPPRTEDGEWHPLMIYGRGLKEQVQSGERQMDDDSLSGSAAPSEEKEIF